MGSPPTVQKYVLIRWTGRPYRMSPASFPVFWDQLKVCHNPVLGEWFLRKVQTLHRSKLFFFSPPQKYILKSHDCTPENHTKEKATQK